MRKQVFTVSNLLSFSRIVLALPTAILIFFKHKYLPLALVFFTVASITDFFDGYFARIYNSHTTLGKFLDPLADKVLIISALFSFYLTGLIDLWVVLAVAIRDVVITLLRVATISQGYVLNPTRAAKLKTALQFVFIYFLFFLASPGISPILYRAVTGMIYFIVGFTVWTGIRYIANNTDTITKIFVK
jgi:CDP-diacylglycerol--glycerol-3-phosphate 3-phosphatidyltransferase